MEDQAAGARLPALARRVVAQARDVAPGRPAVGAAEQARRLDAGVDRPVGPGRQAPHGRDGLAVLAVRQADRRVGPGLAQVLAAEDRGSVPGAAAGREDGARARLHDHVVDRPAFARRTADRPVGTVRVALEDERALGGADEEQGAGGHRAVLRCAGSGWGRGASMYRDRAHACVPPILEGHVHPRSSRPDLGRHPAARRRRDPGAARTGRCRRSSSIRRVRGSWSRP